MALAAEHGGIDEGEAFARLVHAEALDAVGRGEEAHAALMVARERLLARAAKINDPALREGSLRDVPEHARTLALTDEETIPASR
jgi:hypothetical protein